MEILLIVALVGFLTRGTFDHARANYRAGRDQRVKEVAKTYPKGVLPKSRQKAAARQHAAGWWAREVRHGFPVTKTGWHAAWLAHQTTADHHKARREEARTTALETRASVLKGMPEHKQRQAEAQAELDAIEKELAAQQAKGSPATGRKAVREAADEVARKRAEKEQPGTGKCPACGAPDGYEHLEGCDPSAPLPADAVTLLTARSKSGRPVNAVTGAPEDTIAVYGKDDLDRRLAAAAGDPDIEVATRPAPRSEDPLLPDASRNPKPLEAPEHVPGQYEPGDDPWEVTQAGTMELQGGHLVMDGWGFTDPHLDPADGPFPNADSSGGADILKGHSLAEMHAMSHGASCRCPISRARYLPGPETVHRSPTTQGAPVTADTNYTTVLTNAKGFAAQADEDAVTARSRRMLAEHHLEEMQAAEVDGATLSSQMDLVEKLRASEEAQQAIGEHATQVSDGLQARHGGLHAAHQEAPVRAAQREFYEGD